MDKTQINIFLILSFLIISTLLIGILYFVFQFRKRKIQEELEKQISINQERERIIKDMHDDIGGSLNSIRLISDVILERNLPEEKMYECVTKIASTSKNISHQIKTVVWSLDAEKDSLINLIEYIKHFAFDLFQFSPIELKFTTNLPFEDSFINGFFRKNVFLVIKESLTNILKHSSATNAEIKIEVASEILLIEISDNGIGINNTNPNGNGIKNINKRIIEINGEVTITNCNGTLLKISTPLK